VKICTWDRAGLFSKIAGTFSSIGLNILSAQIFTRGDGIVLDTFFVTDARSGNLADRNQRDEFEKLLNLVLTGEAENLHALIAKQKISRPRQLYLGEEERHYVPLDRRPPPKVRETAVSDAI
jgi:[protein-PII] uridylyltransferase